MKRYRGNWRLQVLSQLRHQEMATMECNKAFVPPATTKSNLESAYEQHDLDST